MMNFLYSLVKLYYVIRIKMISLQSYNKKAVRLIRRGIRVKRNKTKYATNFIKSFCRIFSFFLFFFLFRGMIYFKIGMNYTMDLHRNDVPFGGRTIRRDPMRNDYFDTI